VIKRDISIVSVVRFPWPWPPSGEVTIYEGNHENIAVRLVGLADGHLRLSIQYTEGSSVLQDYQKLQTEECGFVILIIVLHAKGPTLYLNGERVLPCEEAQGEVQRLNVGKTQRTSVGLPPFSNPSMLDDEQEALFVGTLIDMSAKVSTGQKYDVIRASGLLRQLLLDDSPLVHQVNRSHRKQLKFKVLQFPKDLPSEHKVNFLWLDIDPSSVPSANANECDLQGFLAALCLRIGDTHYSVGDVIKLCAHVKGGIHSGKPKTQAETELLNLDRKHRLFEQEPSIAAMRGIARVALSGLWPLVQAIWQNVKGAQPNAEAQRQQK